MLDQTRTEWRTFLGSPLGRMTMLSWIGLLAVIVVQSVGR
jgi:hypothetical protein